MNVAAYIRVSSRGQDHTMQRAAILKAAASRGDAIAAWYGEKRSATKMQRPELDRLRADLRAGKLRRVYGFRLDRFIRTGPADAFRFAEECHAAGAELLTVADGVHLKPGADDIVTTVLLFAFSLAAKLELAARAERIAARRELAEERGEPWGRPRRWTAQDAARIVARAERGESVRTIAQAVRMPRETVRRILLATRNPPRAAPPPNGSEPRREEGTT